MNSETWNDPGAPLAVLKKSYVPPPGGYLFWCKKQKEKYAELGVKSKEKEQTNATKNHEKKKGCV